MSITNAARAERLDAVLRGYDSDDTDRGSLIDLLADARHWCDRRGECFGDLDLVAHDHYLAELSDERRPS